MRTQLSTTTTCGSDGPKLLRMLGKALHKQSASWRPQLYKNNQIKSLAVTGRQRDEIVHWLSQLNKKFKFYPETFQLSTVLLDAFLQQVKAHPKYLRCIGIACFYLAAKVLEESELVPGMRELMERSECGFSRAELLRMERVILDKLSWDLSSRPTTLDFLHILHALVLVREPGLLSGVAVTPGRQLSLLTHKLSRCTPHHSLLTAPPSCRALAILSLELELFRPDWLPITLALQTLIQVSSEDVIHCREAMTRVLTNSNNAGRVRSITVPQHKMYAAITKPTKRKVETTQMEDDDDLYDDIKKLYNEEGLDSCAGGGGGASKAPSCGSEVRHECAPPLLALQTVAN